MRAVRSTSTLLLFFLLLGGPAEATAEAAVCSPESYLPYVAVARWSAVEPVRLSILPLTRPLGVPRAVVLPEEMAGPVRLRCGPGSFDLWTRKGSLRIGNPTSRSPSAEPAPEVPVPDLEDFAHFACREGELDRDPLRTPHGRNRQLPVDLSRRFEPYRIGLRRIEDDGKDAVRWSLVVHEEQRRGTPGGRLSRSHAQREVTVLELVCPRPGR